MSEVKSTTSAALPEHVFVLWLTVDYVDIGATSRYARNIEEEDVVLSEGHDRIIVA